MKKLNSFLVLLLALLALDGCKKNENLTISVRINFFNISPQQIDDTETALIIIDVSNPKLGERVVMIRTLVDYGSVNPSIIYTTGNPAYFQYTPPDLDSDRSQQVLIAVLITGFQGNEFDRVEGMVELKST